MQLGKCNWKLNQDSSCLFFNWGANILFGYQIPQRTWNISPHAQSTKEISGNWFCNSWALSLRGRDKKKKKKTGKKFCRDGSCYVLSPHTHPEKGREGPLPLCHLSLYRGLLWDQWMIWKWVFLSQEIQRIGSCFITEIEIIQGGKIKVILQLITFPNKGYVNFPWGADVRVCIGWCTLGWSVERQKEQDAGD